MAIVMGRLKNKENIFIVHNLRKSCINKGVLKGFTIASKTIPYFVNLNSALIELKSLHPDGQGRQKDFTYRMTEDECFRYEKNWWISPNKSGKIGPMRDRSHFNEALTTLHRLHQESGEEQLAPIPYWQYQKWHPSSSSSSTSWWQWNDSWWSS